MPTKTSRLPAQGRPPRRFTLNFGSRGSIFFHCASLSSTFFRAIDHLLRKRQRGNGPAKCLVQGQKLVMKPLLRSAPSASDQARASMSLWA